MNKSIGVAGSLLLVSVFLVPAVSLAAQVQSGNQVTIASSQIIKNDLYLAGGSVTSNGTIQGDLTIAGGSLLINGPVSQDILAAGGNITILSAVGNDVRAAGGNIVVDGAVQKDVAVVGGQTEISGTGVGGDVLWAGGSLQVDAPVGGNLQLRGGQALIDSTVHGNVQFTGNKLTLGPSAVIDGTLEYSAQNPVTIETGALVKGTTSYQPQPKTTSTPATWAGIAAIASIFVLLKFLALLVFALVIGLVFRRFSKTLVHTALEQPLLETGRGLVVLIVLPIASILLLVSVIGIPLGVLGLISFVALLIVATCFASVVMGSLVHKWIFKPSEYKVTWQTILLGVVVYTIIGFIPFLGWIVKFLFILAALGAIVKVKWSVIKEWR